MDRTHAMASICAAAVLALAASQPAVAGQCKAIHGDLIENQSTTGCIAPATTCFLGEVAANHGVRGSTHFAADSARAGPATSPAFVSYSGLFHYFTDKGTLVMRETGVSGTPGGTAEPGVVTAYQRIQEGTGDFTGATGFFFVSGHRANGVVETTLHGELCLP